MRIVVTGASGFLGNHLCRALSAAGYDVIGVSRSICEGFPFIQVEDYRHLPSGDILIHLAETAESANALAAGEEHVRQTSTTLQAIAQDFDRVIYASSAAVYGDQGTTPRRVGDLTSGDSPYARAKLKCEEYVASIGGTSIRLANLFGPGMSATNVVSHIVKQIPGRGPLVVVSKTPVRDFLWIEDAVSGLLALVERGSTGIFNLGSGQGTAVGDLASIALTAAGEDERPIRETDKNHRFSNLVLDCSATVTASGWRPRTTVEQGICRLVLGAQRNAEARKASQ